MRTGARWQLGPDAVVGVEATRQASDAGEADNQVMLRAALRFLTRSAGRSCTDPPLVTHGPRTRPHAVSLQKVRPVLPGAPARAESAENVMPELTRKLRAAAESDDVEAIDALIDAGANPNAKNLAAIPRSTPRPTRARWEPSGPCSRPAPFATQGMPTEPLRSISPCAKVATTQPMRCATHEAHDDVDRQADSSTSNVQVCNSGAFTSRRLRRLKRAMPAPVSMFQQFALCRTVLPGSCPWTSALSPSTGWLRGRRTVASDAAKPRSAISITEASPVSSSVVARDQTGPGASACTMPTGPCGVSIVTASDKRARAARHLG